MLPFGSSGMISFTRSCVTASLFAHVTKSLNTRRSDWAVGGAGLAGLGLGGGAVAAFEAGPEPDRPDPNGDFADTAVLITGATTGIGHATAIAFANRGAKVFFCGRRNELGLANQDQIRLMGGDATFHRTDLREEGQVREFFRRRMGRPLRQNRCGVQQRRGRNPWRRANTRTVRRGLEQRATHARGVPVDEARTSAHAGGRPWRDHQQLLRLGGGGVSHHLPGTTPASMASPH